MLLKVPSSSSSALTKPYRLFAASPSSIPILRRKSASICASSASPIAAVEVKEQGIGSETKSLADRLRLGTLVENGLSYKEKFIVRCYEVGINKTATVEAIANLLQRIQSEQITVDGVIVTDPSTILRSGSKLVYRRLPWKEPDAPYLLEVLFEDDDLIALNKPSGLQVLPGGLFQQRTVLTQFQRQASQDSEGSSLACHPVPVHRLGRGTSGVLLYAKTKLAKTSLSIYFTDGTSVLKDSRNSDALFSSKRKISKIYRALASGILDEDEVVIKQPIGVVRYSGLANGLYVASPEGKPALSKVKVLERNIQGNCTLLEVEIQSGRPHQIRIHLSYLGHPLVGDPLYITGGLPKCLDLEAEDGSFALDGPVYPVPGDCGYHLHAHRVVMSHPTTSEMLKIIAPLPPILRTNKESNSNLCLPPQAADSKCTF